MYSIEKISNIRLGDDTHQGYAFIDSRGHTIIQVYGESIRNRIKNYLDEQN